jgi:hypothetical protein
VLGDRVELTRARTRIASLARTGSLASLCSLASPDVNPIRAAELRPSERNAETARLRSAGIEPGTLFPDCLEL